MEMSIARLLVVAGDLAGGFVTAWLGVQAWRNRDDPAALPFGALTFVVTIWSFADAISLLATSESLATAALVASRVAATQVAPLWVLFALAYTGYTRWQRKSVLALLWLFPAAYSVLLIFAPLHSLIDVGVTFQSVNGVTAPVLSKDISYRLATAMAYLLVVGGFYQMVRHFLRSRNVYRNQTASIVLMSLFPLVANAVFVLGWTPHPGLDVTPPTFALAGAVIGWELFKYDILTVAPLASDVLIQELPDPVLVLDEDDDIVDYNQAAASVLDGESLRGRDLQVIAPELSDRLGTDQLISELGQDDTGDEYVVFRPQTRKITDRRGKCRGRLVVLRDVSVQQRRLDRIEALQATTEQYIDARIVDEVARVAVSFVERVLDQDFAAVFLAEEDRLEPAALSDALEATLAESPTAITESNEALWSVYHRGDSQFLQTHESSWPPLSTVQELGGVLVLSLGDNGLLCIGSSSADGYTAEDRQFANILAGSTAAAMDRVEREQELRENRRVVRQRTEQLEFLNGVLRHNIRNGMQVIDSNVDLLARHVDDEGNQHLDLIRDRTNDLTKLTETIRSITDTFTAEQEGQLQAADLGLALSDGIGTVREDHAEAAIEVLFDDNTTVLANELLADVFENTLRNAIESNNADQTRIEIDVTTVGDWVQVHFADNGPGVSDHLKESLFERDVAISQTAHGFGVYFVAVMMDLYEGDFWYEDNDPQGAIAVLEFQRPTDDGGH